MPGTTMNAAAIFVSKPSPTQTPASSSQRARPSSSPRTTSDRAATAQRTSSASGLLCREIATAIGVVASATGDEAGQAAEAPAHEVVDERNRRHAHQRLRHEHAQRVVAEGLDERDLDPERERRLVDRHHAGRVERAVEERVPARAHRAHGGAVVLVRPPVAREPPQVQDAGEDEQAAKLVARARDGTGPGAEAGGSARRSKAGRGDCRHAALGRAAGRGHGARADDDGDSADLRCHGSSVLLWRRGDGHAALAGDGRRRRWEDSEPGLGGLRDRARGPGRTGTAVSRCARRRSAQRRGGRAYRSTRIRSGAAAPRGPGPAVRAVRRYRPGRRICIAALKLVPRTCAPASRTRRQRPSPPLNSTRTRTGPPGRTRPDSRSTLPDAMRRRGGRFSATEGTTATLATVDRAVPEAARTWPERRHGTCTAQDPSPAAVARATVTHAPLCPRFCNETGSPAAGPPPGRITRPANDAAWP